jgi:hypothetical protein
MDEEQLEKLEELFAKPRGERRKILQRRYVHPDLKELFLSYADQFTIWHIKLFALTDDSEALSTIIPDTSPNRIDVSPQKKIREIFIEKKYENLKENPILVDSIWTDLLHKKLVDKGTEWLNSYMSITGPHDPIIITQFGKRFLEFITGYNR